MLEGGCWRSRRGGEGEGEVKEKGKRRGGEGEKEEKEGRREVGMEL